jgi:hypothetical protein
MIGMGICLILTMGTFALELGKHQNHLTNYGLFLLAFIIMYKLSFKLFSCFKDLEINKPLSFECFLITKETFAKMLDNKSMPHSGLYKIISSETSHNNQAKYCLVHKRQIHNLELKVDNEANEISKIFSQLTPRAAGSNKYVTINAIKDEFKHTNIFEKELPSLFTLRGISKRVIRVLLKIVFSSTGIAIILANLFYLLSYGLYSFHIDSYWSIFGLYFTGVTIIFLIIFITLTLFTN